ncbi:MAG: hypothetical protein GY854_16805 [Deltaproteobacteria bacterium]|nr:hypothetical protein [Deltaproteobacteria bacterium]
MAVVEEKRVQYRRYEDRRIALMVSVYETLFNKPAGPDRNSILLKVILENYRADRAAIGDVEKPGAGPVRIVSTVGDWEATGKQLAGPGLDTLMNLQDGAPGALTLTRVKRPQVFSSEAWDSLWVDTLEAQTTALLSVQIKPERAPSSVLWILQTNYSREWSSRDRDLAEEVASVLARSHDKDAS